MSWSDASSAAQIFALGAALFYFLYRVLAGWYNTALTVDLTVKRVFNRVQNSDILIITLKIEHGDHGALHLLAAEAQVVSCDSKTGKTINSVIIPFVGIGRVGIVPQKTFLDYRLSSYIDWDRRGSRPFRLSPKERTQFECVANVSPGAICNVQIVMLGRKPLSTAVAQWRASAISVPHY